MSKHTPGPWEFDADSRLVRDESSGSAIARIESDDGHANPRHRHPLPFEANGLLIAAATDLLAACEMIEAWFVELDNIDSINGDAALAKNRNVVHAKRRLAIRAAIAKATGGAK